MITMRARIPLRALLYGLVLSCGTSRAPAAEAPRDPRALAPALEGLGTLHHPITTRSEAAQRFFDQGLRLVYAFNHNEALRAFQEAARLDPRSAMAHWGQALALGPNINDPMPFERELKAHAAIRRARALLRHASPAERGYVLALSTRYSNRKERDRAALDRAYANAMAGHARHYPDDLDAATLQAESLMNVAPWDYWTKDGQPKGDTATLVSVIESVLRRQPDHPGALHLHIHAVEAVWPDQALPSADRLGALMPAAGHMVHMPAHIYIRTGRYLDAAEANVKAIAADEYYLEQCRAQGLYPALYYPHNIHFLWAAATLEGRSALALESARKMAGKLTKEHTCGPAAGQDWSMTPLYALVRFGRWDAVLAEPQPSPKPLGTALWHYARGMAFAGKREFESAAQELAKLESFAGHKDLQADNVGFDPAATIVKLAARVLQGETASRAGRHEAGIAALREAVAMQDALRYNEPPEWHQPVRHQLGAALLEAGRAAEAEAVYLEDLKDNRENGWALFGLLQALRAQGRADAAQAAEARFKKAWERADVVLTASRF